MLSAEEVVDQIQHGQVPDHWHIVKGRGSPLKTALRTLAFFLVCWFVGISLARGLIDVFLAFAFGVGGETPRFDVLLIVGIFFSLIALFRAWRWSEEAQHSFLILEPEGFMLLTHDNSPSKRRLVTYFYGNIASIDLKLRLNYFLRNPGYPALRMNICAANGAQFWVDIDTRFGSPLKTAQMIIVAHAQYRALHAYVA